MARILTMLAVITCLVGCNLVLFDEYDYETNEDAHIGIKGVDADVHKVRGGLFVNKKIQFGKPPQNIHFTKNKTKNRNERVTF